MTATTTTTTATAAVLLASATTTATAEAAAAGTTTNGNGRRRRRRRRPLLASQPRQQAVRALVAQCGLVFLLLTAATTSLLLADAAPYLLLTSSSAKCVRVADIPPETTLEIRYSAPGTCVCRRYFFLLRITVLLLLVFATVAQLGFPKAVRAHLFSCFAVLQIPSLPIKTKKDLREDDGSGNDEVGRSFGAGGRGDAGRENDGNRGNVEGEGDGLDMRYNERQRRKMDELSSIVRCLFCFVLVRACILSFLP